MRVDIECTVEQSSDGDYYTAHCLPLDVVHCADRKEDAVEGLRRLVEIELECMKWNTLKAIAAQRGESVEAVEEQRRVALKAGGWILAEAKEPRK